MTSAILRLTDRAGDAIAVDAARIVGLETADLRYEDGAVWRATLLKCERGVTFVVSEPFDAVYRAWLDARGETAAPRINPYPSARGWELHPALTDGSGGAL